MAQLDRVVVHHMAEHMKDCVDMLRDMSQVLQFQQQLHQGLQHNQTELADSEQMLNVIHESSAILATQVDATLRSLQPLLDTEQFVVDQHQSDQMLPSATAGHASF